MANPLWWFKFEYRIWRTDPALRRCSLETRGFWLECLCIMHETDADKIEGTYDELSRLFGDSPEIIARCCLELKRTETADVTLGNGNVTLMSRRRKRELNDREQTRLRVKRHRVNECNADVTTQSKSKSKSKSKKKEVRSKSEDADASSRTAATKQTDEEWLSGLQINPVYQLLEVRNEFARAQVWAETNGRQCTRRFFVNWLNRAKPITGVQNGTNKPQSFQDRRAEIARESYKRESEIRQRVRERDQELSGQVISSDSRLLSPVEPNTD